MVGAEQPKRGMLKRLGRVPHGQTLSSVTLWFWLSAVSLFSGVGLAVLSVTDLLRLVGCLLTAASAPVFVYTTAIEFLSRRLGGLQSDIADSLSRGLASYFAAYGGTDDVSGDATEPETRLLLATVCLPITSRVAKQQYGRPLLLEYDLDIRMDYLGKLEYQGAYMGEVAVFTRTASYKLYLPTQADIARLFPPFLVVDEKALEIKAVPQLAAAGYLEFLWPLPPGSISSFSQKELAGVKWIDVEPIALGGDATVTYSPTPLPSAEQIREILGVDARAIAPKDVDRIAANSILMGHAVLSDGARSELTQRLRGSRTISLAVKSTYQVLVKGREPGAQPDYRYDVPLARPATVRRIRCALDGGVRREVRLTRASVNASFPLASRSIVDHPEDQDLRWLGADDSPIAPFLPGHGVEFHWERTGKQEDAAELPTA